MRPDIASQRRLAGHVGRDRRGRGVWTFAEVSILKKTRNVNVPSLSPTDLDTIVGFSYNAAASYK